jgi:hypothetical protein
VAGQQLAAPLVAKAVDSSGNPVSGQVINFRVVSGGGTVFAGSGITSDSGIAQELWTLGTSTADSQKVEARAVDPVTGAPLVFGTFIATALPGPAAGATRVAGDSQPGDPGQPLAESLAVRIADQFGNVIPAASVSWSAAAGAGSVSPATSVTDSAGIARTAWTMGSTAGEFTATATSGAATAVFHARGQPSVSSISVGLEHACGSDVNGAAFCWGYGAFGTLGDSALDSCQNPHDCRTRPVRVRGGALFASVSAGGQQSCGLTSTGTAYCWGDLRYLGDGGTANAFRTDPGPVSGGHAFASLAAGFYSTCGVTTTGSAYCWGEGLAGSLGDGVTTAEVAPSPVAVTGGIGFATIGVGTADACGSTTSGSAYCWGSNRLYQLGQGSDTLESCGIIRCSSVPVAVQGGLSFTSVTTNGSTSCGLAAAAA